MLVRPEIVKSAGGVVVPIPTNPVFLSTKRLGSPTVEEVETENNVFPTGVVDPTESTPAKVDVAVELELIPPPTCKRPAILTLLLKVEDAVEVRPAS